MVGIELELALELIEKEINEIDEFKEVSIENALGRIIKDDIYATINQPVFDRSPLDGYALRAIDTKGASKQNPINLKVVDEVFAGSYSHKRLKENEAIRIMTGAKMPEGSNCVIRQENTNYGMETVDIYEELKEYENYCFEGEDIKKGTKLISKGDKLDYIHIGILSSIGMDKVLVKRKIKVAVISTGDEVMESGKSLLEGKIYDSNRRIIEARLKSLGCEVVLAKIMGDNEFEISKEIDSIIDKADVVITTGGVSVGKKDIMHEVIKILCAHRIFWRVNLKPGTPAIFAIYKNKPLMCLSGNPFAAIATFELLAKPILYKLSKDNTLNSVRKHCIFDDEFLKESKGRRFIRAIYEDGKVHLPKGGHSSGMLSSMIGCNCLIDIKPKTPKLIKGDMVEVVLF